MKKHKVGDKFVIEIDKVFSQDGETLYRAKGMKSLVFDEYGLNILKPLSAYTDPLETNLRGWIEENKRMLRESNYSEHDLAHAKADGHVEAWELSKKLFAEYKDSELDEIFGKNWTYPKLMEMSYLEAAAKVAEWERMNEEICVGDIVRFRENHNAEFCVTEIYDDRLLYGIDVEGGVYADRDIKLFEKTGRHIDIKSMLAQIGGKSE